MPEDALPSEATNTPPSDPEWTDDTDAIADASDPVPSPRQNLDADWDADPLEWEDEFMSEPPPSPAPSMQEALAWLRPVWQKGRTSWQRILRGVRSRLPLAAKLPDVVLSSILIGILVLLLTLINSVRQPAVAQPPPPTTTPVEVPPTAAPTDPAPVTAAPAAEPDAAIAAEPSELPKASEPTLDPAERDRIAAIQTQLADGSLNYGANLLKSVQADFNHNRLTANLSTGWYSLAAAEQDALANDLRQRAAAMEFGTLELRSPTNVLLARSPVVGHQMVILQRTQPIEVPVPPRPRYRLLVDR